MNEALLDSTNLQNRLTQELKPHIKGKKLAPLGTISDLLVTTQSMIDFGNCICGSVHERKLGVIILQPQQFPRVISIKILFEDERLEKLPEYIFGVRKENSFDYFDDYKFKAMQKGTYSFVVGVKTPTLTLPVIKAKIQIAVQGFKGTIEVNLIQTPFTPQIKCNRQLISESGIRLLKLGLVKNKSKKEVKVAFKCTQNVAFSFIAQLVGHPEEKNQSYVDVKPKNFQVGGKGAFILNFCLNSLEVDTYPFCVRRVLIIKIKDTQIHFHFPLEVMFYAGGTSFEPSIE